MLIVIIHFWDEAAEGPRSFFSRENGILSDVRLFLERFAQESRRTNATTFVCSYFENVLVWENLFETTLTTN